MALQAESVYWEEAEAADVGTARLVSDQLARWDQNVGLNKSA